MIDSILQTIQTEIQQIIKQTVDINFEIPKEENFGDYSTNIAMKLAKEWKKSPIIIANEIVSKINLTACHLKKCEIAGPGFINFFIDRTHLSKVIYKIIAEKNNYGNLKIGNENINLEFVSANPTGYLHIGHGRGAAYGDSLARILKKAGFTVTKEHYVNDAGNQIHNLAHSIYERYKEIQGLDCQLHEDDYHGKEIIVVAKQIFNEVGDAYLSQPWFEYFRDYGTNYLLDGLKKDLKKFHVEFDVWFSERSLYENKAVEKTLQFLIDEGFTYEKDGAVWLKTTLFKDEKDRVLVKSDKSYTYLTPDIAYHANKLNRGFDRLIDVLGADHHGYIERLKAAIACLGKSPEQIDIEILQMVRVIQDGVELKMSKRSGKAITLRDLMDEIGTDALRYMYAAKALSTPMDLDLDLALKQTNENPVYYIQYAYARIASLFRTYEEMGLKWQLPGDFIEIDLDKLDKLILLLAQYPLIIKEAALKRIPHKIAQYCYQLAAALHYYYNDEKIITENSRDTVEKLSVLKAVQIVLKNSLDLIGVNVKEKM